MLVALPRETSAGGRWSLLLSATRLLRNDAAKGMTHGPAMGGGLGGDRVRVAAPCEKHGCACEGGNSKRAELEHRLQYLRAKARVPICGLSINLRVKSNGT